MASCHFSHIAMKPFSNLAIRPSWRLDIYISKTIAILDILDIIAVSAILSLQAILAILATLAICTIVGILAIKVFYLAALPPSPMVSMIIKLCHQFTPTWFHYIPPRQESRRRMYWIFQKPENPSWPPPHQQPSYMCFLHTGLVWVSLLCHWCTKWIPNNYVDNEW